MLISNKLPKKMKNKIAYKLKTTLLQYLCTIKIKKFYQKVFNVKLHWNYWIPKLSFSKLIIQIAKFSTLQLVNKILQLANNHPCQKKYQKKESKFQKNKKPKTLKTMKLFLISTFISKIKIHVLLKISNQPFILSLDGKSFQ